MTLIAPNADYITQLRQLVESPATLARNGYIIQPLTDDELSLKTRCVGCGKNKTMHQLRVKRTQNNELSPQPKAAGNTLPQPAIQKALTVTDYQKVSAKAGDPEPPKFCCRYHPGQLIRKVWTCCGQAAAAEPCGGAAMHVPQKINMATLSRNYQFHPTPPVLRDQRRPRIAVALDCEMGTAKSGDSEPIRVTLIDYFSGEILLNNIISPDVPMQHLNTKYSGVTWDDLNKAKRQRTCLWGNAGTREALWRHIGLETIVIGHGASNDLRVLRWIHRSVVDSLIIESTRAKRAELKKAAKKEASDESSVGPRDYEGGARLDQSSAIAACISESSSANAPKAKAPRKPGQLSLKTLAKVRLGRDIQTGGRKGHDSLEDAIAARDLVHWSIMNPEEDISY